MDREMLEKYRQAAPVQGAYVGILWILSFISMANALTSPILSFLGMGIGIGSLLTIPVMVYKFRWHVCFGNLSYMKSWLLVVQVIFYASILMAFGVYLYMKFLDGGRFGAYYEQMLEDPVVKATIEQMLSGSGMTAEEFVAQFTALTPINLALSIMESNLILGFLISLPLALLSRIRLGNKTEKN